MILLDPDLVAAPLSVALREGSQTAHTAAESSTFMAELVRGRINARGYRDYLLRFREVYLQLEATGHELADDPAVAAVIDPALERSTALAADLAYWTAVVGEPVASSLDSPAAAAYCAQVIATRAWAPLFVAHHYTRYLGDLSGGQVVGRVLDSELALGGAGIAFYRFPDIPKPKPYKDGYRARLDALELGPGDKARLVEEVSTAFALNQGIFTELGERLDDYRH